MFWRILIWISTSVVSNGLKFNVFNLLRSCVKRNQHELIIIFNWLTVKTYDQLWWVLLGGKNQNDRFFTQNIGKLFIRTLEKRGTVETHFPYFVWKLSRKIVQIFSETSTNKDETGLFAWTTAVVICNACKVDITAGNDSDWLILTLTLVTLCGGGRVQ